MASQELINIIIQAKDEATATAKKVDASLRNMGKSASSSMKQATRSTEEYRKALNSASNELSVVGGSAVQAANLLHQMKLDPNFSSTLNRARLEVSQMGMDISSLRGRFEVLKTAGSTVWTDLKSKVTSTATTISTKMGTALDRVRQKLIQASNGAKGFGNSMTLLRGIAENFIAMIGFEAVGKIVELGKASINASASFDYFGKRMMNATGQTKMSSQQFQQFRKDVADLQKEFRKVDMTAVGASAEELAVKLKLPASSLKDLTKTIAVTSSAFVKEGRTQEDAILAVSDALDGQFQKLKELGIQRDDLIKTNKWNGDISDTTGLLEALNEVLGNMGFEDTAKDITTLDEAFLVMNVAFGQLLAGVLIPLTPIIIGIIEALITMVDMLKNAWDSLPDWGKMAVGVGAVALAIGILVSAVGTLSIFGTVFGAISSIILGISAPVVAIVVAIGLLAIAVYEVGKAFGWWTNVSTMIEAIQKNIGRLWDAFIHHPDVQATINAIVLAWVWLQNALKPVVAWLKGIWDEMFPESAKGKVDGTRAVINALGKVFEYLLIPIKTVITIFQMLYNALITVRTSIILAQMKFGAFGGFLATLTGPITLVWSLLKQVVCILLGCSPGIVPALHTVQEVFSDVWNGIAGFIGGVVDTIVSAIQPIIDVLTIVSEFIVSYFAYSWQTMIMVFSIVSNGISSIVNTFNMFLSGQISLGSMLTSIWMTLQTMFITVFTTILARLVNFASQMLSKAINLGSKFVNNIMNYIKQLPSKVYSQLTAVASRIISAGQQWVNNAKSKAQSIVSNVVSVLSGLPGKITSALSGVVNAIVKPFKDAYSQVSSWVSQISSKVSEVVGLAGGLTSMLAGGEIDRVENGYNAGVDLSTASITVSTNNEVNGEIKIVHDFINLPSGVDASEVAEIVIATANNDEFGKAIASNTGFQSADSKLKSSLANRINRTLGV